MAVLTFSLSPESIGRVYELLICLAKFGEYVSIEATSDKFTLTALNLSRTAYASFALDAKTFFISYEYQGSNSAKVGDRFTCQLLNKALQSVFKGRASETKGRETTVERCDLSIQDQPDKTECRLIVKMMCKHGMTKTHRLTYESTEVMHALFDKVAALQGWKISARVLREYIEFIGPKTEQLGVLAQEGKAIFTSFTEKIQNGKEVLKQPLETAISIHTGDFEDFHMQENMHIIISVKDFKAIVTHAETLRTSITAYLSYPTKPLQFSYQNFGVHCEFTLMTSGDHRGSSSTPGPNFVSSRGVSRQASVIPVQTSNRSTSEMPPPTRPVTKKPSEAQKSQPPLPAPIEKPRVAEHSKDPDSLFLPPDDSDQTWDPPNFDNEEDEEMLGWDASNERPHASFHPTFQDSAPTASSQHQNHSLLSYYSEEGLEPTQRLSQLHGMFD